MSSKIINAPTSSGGAYRVTPESGECSPAGEVGVVRLTAHVPNTPPHRPLLACFLGNIRHHKSVCLSVVCDVVAPHSESEVELFGNILHHLIA